MAASKFLSLLNGRIRETIATVTSSGATDDGKIVALDSTGRLDNSVMPVGIGTETKSIIASENLASGNLVNIWNNAGTFNVRKADATTSGKEAHGFILASAQQGDPAEVFLEGSITGLSGLLPGRYYLSTTPGEVTPTAPAAANNVVQFIGISISSSELTFEPGDGVILA